jgi:hypothetical protein
MAFQEVVRPELVAILQENLPSFDSTLLERSIQAQKGNHSAVLSKLSEQYEGVSSDIRALKLELQNTVLTQQRIERCILGEDLEPGSKIRKRFPSIQDPGSSEPLPKEVESSTNMIATGYHCESLKEV